MIERYDNPDDNGWMNPDSSGEWVLYSDYAKLEARNKKLQAVVDVIKELFRHPRLKFLIEEK